MVIKQRLLARLGELVEFRLAPPIYRRARVVTLSESSKREIVDLLGLRPANIDVVAPGVDRRFSPGGTRASHPLVVAVGRLVPVKRFDLLIDALAAVRQGHPQLEAVLVGEGYERPALEARIRAAGAGAWLHLAGRVDDNALVDLYRRAWVVTSTSLREGWGMTLTEAAACATPAVVTDIAGHRDAVDAGRSGLLARPGGPEDPTGVAAALDRVLGDRHLRDRLSTGALAHAERFTWEATARGTLNALVAEAAARRR
jgi:glycosyltransferase involved in cell wall biosynthesis